MKRLLVPTDFSEASRIAVGHAVELSEAVGAELLLLHVVDVTKVGSPHLAGIRQAFRMTIEPTRNAFSCEVPHAADDQGLCAEAEWKLAALLPPVDADRPLPAWWSARWLTKSSELPSKSVPTSSSWAFKGKGVGNACTSTASRKRSSNDRPFR
jgi:Universal stress protein family